MNFTANRTSTIRPTPGPWAYDMDYIVAPDPDGIHPDIYIAEIAHDDDEGRVAAVPQQDANRRLIAAAPELLDAVEGLLAAVARLPILLQDGPLNDAVMAAHGVLAKVQLDWEP